MPINNRVEKNVELMYTYSEPRGFIFKERIGETYGR